MNSAMNRLSAGFGGIVGFLPSLLAGILILAVGYIIALVLERATRALLGRVKYDNFLSKLGIIDHDRVDARRGSLWTGKAVFALVMLATIMQAARTWDLQLVATGIARLIAYVPHVIAAALILGATVYFSNWVRARIARNEAARDQSAGTVTSQRPLVASSVRAGILTLGAFMALRELQIAPEIVTTAFTLTLASIALAAALAFGLGSRGVAAQVTQQWYGRRTSGNGVRERNEGNAAHGVPPAEG